jgi:hypothetical protein
VRGPAVHHMTKGLVFVFAGALAFAVVAVTPKPVVSLSNPQFTVSQCETSSMTRTVSATFTLTNQGKALGVVDVSMNVDGSLRVRDEFGIPAESSIQRGLSGVLPDCDVHEYSLHMVTPSGRTHPPYY